MDDNGGNDGGYEPNGYSDNQQANDAPISYSAEPYYPNTQAYPSDNYVSYPPPQDDQNVDTFDIHRSKHHHHKQQNYPQHQQHYPQQYAPNYTPNYNPQYPVQNNALFVPTHPPVHNTAPMVVQYNSDRSREKREKKAQKQLALILLIVGFFFGGLIIWPINFILHRKSKSKKARKYALVSLILTIISILFYSAAIVIPIIVGIIRSIMIKKYNKDKPKEP